MTFCEKFESICQTDSDIYFDIAPGSSSVPIFPVHACLFPLSIPMGKLIKLKRLQPPEPDLPSISDLVTVANRHKHPLFRVILILMRTYYSAI